MIRKRVPQHETVINLDGPDGNANHLIGIAVVFGRDARMSEESLKSIVDEMRSGDYKNLITTFDKYFGGSIVLETTNTELLA